MNAVSSIARFVIRAAGNIAVLSIPVAGWSAGTQEEAESAARNLAGYGRIGRE